MDFSRTILEKAVLRRVYFCGLLSFFTSDFLLRPRALASGHLLIIYKEPRAILYSLFTTQRNSSVT
jgi:hypothetical protein